MSTKLKSREEQIDNKSNNSKIIRGNRRLIREKVLQILVAYFTSNIDINLLVEHIFCRIFCIDENDIVYENTDNDTRLLNEVELMNIDLDVTIQWKEEEIEYGKDIIFSTIKNYDSYVDYIENASLNWGFSRITIIDRTIIMIAITEFIFAPDVPIKVSINEALELAKNYSTDKSPVFVNGILEKIKHMLEDKKIINKSERGTR